MSSDQPDGGSDWVTPGSSPSEYFAAPQPPPSGAAPPPPGYGAPPPGYGPPPPGYGAPPPGYGTAPPYGSPYGYAPPYAVASPKPGVVPLRPLGVGELLDGSFTTIRRYPGATLGLAAVVMLFVELVQLIATYFLLNGVATETISSNGTIETSTDFLARTLTVDGLVLIVTTIATVLLSGMLTAVVGQAVLGRPMGISQAWERAKPLFWRLVGATLLVALIELAVIVVAVVPGLLVLAAGSDGGGVALLVVGILAAIPVEIYLYTALCLTTPALVLEKLSVTQSLRRSRALVKTSWWRIFGITLLAGVIASVLGGIIQLPFALAGGISSFISSTHTDTSFQFSTLVITGIGGLLASTLVRPFAAGVGALLYIDRRMRAEALDLTLQRAAAQQPS